MTQDKMIVGHLYSLPNWMEYPDPLVVLKCSDNKLRYVMRKGQKKYMAHWEICTPVGAEVSSREGWEPVIVYGKIIKSPYKVADSHVRPGSEHRVKFVNKKYEEEEMSKNVDYIGGDYKVVKCVFIGDKPHGRSYNYKIDIEIKVKDGDTAVVESSNGLGLVEVVEVLENCVRNAAEVKKATAWVVCIVDMSRQDARKRATEERDYILQQLDEKKKAFEALNAYALLAQADPEAQKLVDKLNKLGR